VRDRRAGITLELLWQDVRYALRQLARNRAFTLTAVLTFRCRMFAAGGDDRYDLLGHRLPSSLCASWKTELDCVMPRLLHCTAVPITALEST
jgi:hypothetical protein